MTNLLFLYLGLKGIHNCVKHKHDNIFIVTYLGYLLVGFGSFCFHSTLKCKQSRETCGTLVLTKGRPLATC